MFLGIDQSFTSTGICVLDENQELVHHQCFNTQKDDGDNYYRAKQITDLIVSLVKKYNPVMTSIEGLAFGIRGNATRDLGGLQYAIIIGLLNIGYDNVSVVPPKSLKKFATDNGKAKKEEMFLALPDGVKSIVELYPKSKGRYDITDAYWLAKINCPDQETKVSQK